jgi:hypothetical protein
VQGELSPWRIRNHLPGRVTRPLGKQYQQPPQDRCVLVPSRGEPVSHGGPHLHVPDLGVEAKLMAGHHVPADCGVTRCREPVLAACQRTWRASAFVLLGTLLFRFASRSPLLYKDGVSYCVWAADRCPLYIRAESTPTGMGICDRMRLATSPFQTPSRMDFPSTSSGLIPLVSSHFLPSSANN